MVYYPTGAVKIADRIIDSSGVVHYSTGNRASEQLPRGGNMPYNMGWRIGVEIDMNTRELVFLVNGQRQPIIVSNLPSSVMAGVCFSSEF